MSWETNSTATPDSSNSRIRLKHLAPLTPPMRTFYSWRKSPRIPHRTLTRVSGLFASAYKKSRVGSFSIPVRSFVCDNYRNEVHVVHCYGRERYSTYFPCIITNRGRIIPLLFSAETYGPRPVLCSGTVIGTRRGINRFLSVLVTEFHSNNQKDNIKCRSPFTTDQWTVSALVLILSRLALGVDRHFCQMNWLYYNGYFGRPAQTKTIPWGTGPVLFIDSENFYTLFIILFLYVRYSLWVKLV